MNFKRVLLLPSSVSPNHSHIILLVPGAGSESSFRRFATAEQNGQGGEGKRENSVGMGWGKGGGEFSSSKGNSIAKR